MPPTPSLLPTGMSPWSGSTSLKTQCVPADFEAIAAQSPVIGGFLNEATGFIDFARKTEHGPVSCMTLGNHGNYRP